MLENYKVSCNSCKKSFSVKYGSIKKDLIHEVFSCSKCRNLFSIINKDKLECPECNNTALIRYSPHAKADVEFYDKMYEQKLLKKKDYAAIIDYWKRIKSAECPACKKKKLVWKLI